MFLHSVNQQDQAVAADGVVSFDLSVNPLSVILLNIRPLNDTGILTNFQRMMGLAGSLNSIRVLHRGASVFSMSGRDALALNWFRHGMLPREANGDDTDNERRCLQLPIMLGRHAYDSESCFPATIRGELTMELDVDVADTGYDGFRFSVETIELLDAKPRNFERKISIARTFAATGLQDFPLPTGRLVRGLLLFGTTPFGGAAPAPSWGRLKTMLDNQEIGFTAADFESLSQLGQLFGRDMNPLAETHQHRVDAASVSATEQTAAGVQTPSSVDGFANYAYLDFDPTRDDAHSIDTSGSSNWLVRADIETADLCRVIQIEKVDV